jgi:CMP/dCMP kinase
VEHTPGVVVAIDGPSGSGKSSAARGVARALGLRYLDTGAMYRALTWWLLDRGVDVTDGDAVRAHVRAPEISIATDPDDPWVKADNKDISLEIRTREVTTSVSAVASVPEVRARLIAQQREIIAGSGIVAEGRDIGSVVAPDADVKVYLTADSAARAARHAADQGTTVAQTESDQDRRDRLDAAQSAMAPDAILLDSTDLTLDQVVAEIVDLTRRVPEKTP